MSKDGIVCPSPLSILGFGLAWAWADFVYAFVTTVYMSLFPAMSRECLLVCNY